jgi:hypothetical protein
LFDFLSFGNFTHYDDAGFISCLPIVLHKFGSKCCEDFFFFLGHHVKNKHNFCIGEAIEQTSHIG